MSIDRIIVEAQETVCPSCDASCLTCEECEKELVKGQTALCTSDGHFCLPCMQKLTAPPKTKVKKK